MSTSVLRALGTGCHKRNGWIFGKVPNCLWPPHPLNFGKLCSNFFLQISFSEIYDAICFKGLACYCSAKTSSQPALSKSPVKRTKICNINFWIENDPPPLDLCRKFICFVRATCPLEKLPPKKGKIPKISIQLPFWSKISTGRGKK